MEVWECCSERREAFLFLLFLSFSDLVSVSGISRQNSFRWADLCEVSAQKWETSIKFGLRPLIFTDSILSDNIFYKLLRTKARQISPSSSTSQMISCCSQNVEPAILIHGGRAAVSNPGSSQPFQIIDPLVLEMRIRSWLCQSYAVRTRCRWSNWQEGREQSKKVLGWLPLSINLDELWMHTGTNNPLELEYNPHPYCLFMNRKSHFSLCIYIIQKFASISLQGILNEHICEYRMYVSERRKRITSFILHNMYRCIYTLAPPPTALHHAYIHTTWYWWD